MRSKPIRQKWNPVKNFHGNDHAQLILPATTLLVPSRIEEEGALRYRIRPNVRHIPAIAGKHISPRIRRMGWSPGQKQTK
jgi:hypothetical protein